MTTIALTELQLAIMTVLWEQGEASVLDIHDTLRAERRLAQSTISTLLARMEDKGVVSHTVDGRQYLYTATVTPEQVRRSVVHEFAERTQRLFAGDIAGVLSHLLEAQDTDPEDLARVRAIIAEKEKQMREKGEAE